MGVACKRGKVNMYEWNNAYQYVMNIRKKYIETFGTLDTFFLQTMCERLGGYENFLSNVRITVFGVRNLIKYQLISNDIDIYSNPNSIYRELRSLVVDMDTEDIVLCPFRKFFNIGEIEETSIENVRRLMSNAKSIEISNKLDGSMQAARFYNGEIVMSGSQALDEEQSYRLKQGKSWIVDGYYRMLKDHPDCTFIFEYISQIDKHVVEYDESTQGLYLIGCRCVSDGYQFPYAYLLELAKKYDVKMTEVETRSLEDILSVRADYKSTEKEGWVIRIDEHMFKLKCDDYLQIHRILSACSSANVIIHAIADDTFDDFISRVPTSYRERVWKIANVIFDYQKNTLSEINKAYKQCNDIIGQKEFAIYVNKNVKKELRGYMFALRKGQEINVLKNRAGGYIKFADIAGVDASHVSVLFSGDSDEF